MKDSIIKKKHVNACKGCRVPDVAPCPLLEILEDKGIQTDRISSCKIKDYWIKHHEKHMTAAIKAGRLKIKKGVEK